MYSQEDFSALAESFDREARSEFELAQHHALEFVKKPNPQTKEASLAALVAWEHWQKAAQKVRLFASELGNSPVHRETLPG